MKKHLLRFFNRPGRPNIYAGLSDKQLISIFAMQNLLLGGSGDYITSAIRPVAPPEGGRWLKVMGRLFSIE
ncbi:hypothetical protein [Duncaniella muris]|uniref:hypothetical protein n=1 Tax=Duncaniella muris TaxID=2094150 RepID=UPI0025B74A30|nr:hypothetical protein [Duncaniella muris]